MQYLDLKIVTLDICSFYMNLNLKGNKKLNNTTISIHTLENKKYVIKKDFQGPDRHRNGWCGSPRLSESIVEKLTVIDGRAPTLVADEPLLKALSTAE